MICVLLWYLSAVSKTNVVDLLSSSREPLSIRLNTYWLKSNPEVNFRNPLALKIRVSEWDSVCCKVGLAFLGLLREMFLEQGFGSLYALLRQQDGFGLAPRIFNVAALMQAI